MGGNETEMQETCGGRYPVPRRFVWLCAAFVGAVTLLVYLPALRNGFVNWDDHAYVFKNLHIRSLDGRFLIWAFTDFYQSNWHPLTWLSHAADYAFWGLDPRGHHLTSVLLHSLNASLVVLLGAELWHCAAWPGTTSGSGRGLLIASCTAGILFGIHPVHVESAAWVSERKDVLCGFFYIAAAIMYLRYVRRSPGGSGAVSFLSHKYYLASLALSALALLSKPMAVSLPAVFLLLDWYPLGRFGRTSTRGILIEKVPFGIMALASSVVTMLAQQSSGAVASMNAAPAALRLAVGMQSLGRYVEALIFPARLSPFYPYPFDVKIISGGYLFPLALVLLISVLCIALMRVQKLWLAAWGCFVLTLAPVLGLVQIGGQAMADRYLYLPSLGPFMAAGCAAAYVSSRVSARAIGRLGLAAAGAFVMAALVFLTWHQIAVWKDSIVLWRTAAAAVPDAAAYRTTYVIYHNLGMAQEDEGMSEEALASYTAAIGLNPAFAQTYVNRGALYARLGRHEQAIRDYTTALSLGPAGSDVYYNRGNSYARAGMNREALEDYTMAIRASSSPQADYYANRGVIYRRLKLDDLAAEDFGRASMLRAAGKGEGAANR